MPELGLRARIGIQTGEVVAGTVERLVTGDAVNVASRFEQTAASGEVLIGEATYALVHESVVAEPVGPLTLKGKSTPVPAYRLLKVLAAPATERLHVSRFVGREHELALIGNAWQQAKTQARCRLMTVIGEAGVGKSRLVAEALATFDVRVVRGRCVPYGEGITYWPVVEVIKQLDAAADRRGGGQRIDARCCGESDRPTSRRRDRMGVPQSCSQEQAPLVVCFDDLQWGEQTFLDLVESTWTARRRAHRCCFCAWLGRSCSSGAPPGRCRLRLEPLHPERTWKR